MYRSVLISCYEMNTYSDTLKRTVKVAQYPGFFEVDKPGNPCW